MMTDTFSDLGIVTTGELDFAQNGFGSSKDINIDSLIL